MYVMTSLKSHVSSGIYYYPVNAVQIGLILFLLVIPSRSPFKQGNALGVLVGLAVVFLVICAAGAPPFLFGLLRHAASTQGRHAFAPLPAELIEYAADP